MSGPARLPHHHKTVLGYCKEFGIPLQLIVNDNPNAFLHDETSFDGKPLRMRQVRNDIRGETRRIAGQSLNSGALDASVTGDDKEMLIALVRHFGSLQKDLAYRGSSKAGWTEPPGAGVDAGKLNEPLALRTLMQNAFWEETASFGDEFEQSATMLQPIGGMDRIAAAFASRLRARIRFNAEVKQIRRSGERGARVVYRDRVDGTEIALEAPIVLVTIPLSVLKEIDADFSPGHKAAIAAGAAGYVPSAKIAFEAKRRFWEEDEQIYGGISWTTQDITQILVSVNRFPRPHRHLLGAYIWTSKIAETFAKLTPAERLGPRAGARREASSDLPRRRRQRELRCRGAKCRSTAAPGASGTRTRRKMPIRCCSSRMVRSCWRASTSAICRVGRKGRCSQPTRRSRRSAREWRRSAV